MKYRFFVFIVLGVCVINHGFADTFVVTNPTRTDYTDEVIKIPVKLPSGAETGRYRVTKQGKELPCQIGDHDGVKRIWTVVSLAAGEKAGLNVERKPPSPRRSPVSMRRDGGVFILDNGTTAVKVPAEKGKAEKKSCAPPSPVQSVRVGGRWVGSGAWHTERNLTRFSSDVTGKGPVFVQAKLHYGFEGEAGLYNNVPAFAKVTVTLYAGRNHAVIDESHEMDRGDFWVFDCAAGWKAPHALCRPHSNGFERPDLGPWPPDALETGLTRMGDTLLHLMPRWTQAYDEGWFFACHDGKDAAGAMVCRAGRWHWPHNNMISIKVRESGGYAGLVCPTWKGRRFWFLVSGPKDIWAEGGAKRYVSRYAFYPLDRIINEFILAWPGGEPSKSFAKKDYFKSGMNPTGAMRGFGRNAMRQINKPGSFHTLTQVQNLLSADAYGSYWNFWSPENPNFFTDYIRGPVAHTMRLRRHPAFGTLAQQAEYALHEDLYHSITLPGGAGQECPGYVAHAMKSWSALAGPCRKHLGFDPAKWPRFKAGASFLLHLSQPIAPGRWRCHPGGDTHPTGPDVAALAGQFGVKENIRSFTTGELPGFGVVFRNRPGTDKETYLAFKSGPNRGHYHGDQLSFHYCANARQIAIDHMCSYGPRAGQEHMHNRVAFHTEKLPYANMDGYERVIAFKRSPEVDVAVGQVESERLRYTTAYPPEGWDVYLPQQQFDEKLIYRRTIVFVKSTGKDFFVIRDQHSGPEVYATYCLHVLSKACKRNGSTFDFGNLTLFCAEPGSFNYSRHDWRFEKTKRGKLIIKEHTRGIRLTKKGRKGSFVTVLYPGSAAPRIARMENGVRVGGTEVLFAGGIDDKSETEYVVVTQKETTVMKLTGEDITMDRCQGEVGLFVPDAGYPFGTIPDWLIRQRAEVPSWAPPWVKEHRRYERKK